MKKKIENKLEINIKMIMKLKFYIMKKAKKKVKIILVKRMLMKIILMNLELLKKKQKIMGLFF